MARKVIALLVGLALLGTLPSTASARKRRHRGTCGTYCRNAGGLGGSPNTPPCRVLNRVITVRDGVAAVTARCTGRIPRGAILISPHNLRDAVNDGLRNGFYGGADFFVRPGRTATFYIGLSRKANALLRRRHSLRVDVLIQLNTHPVVSANTWSNIPMRLN